MTYELVHFATLHKDDLFPSGERDDRRASSPRPSGRAAREAHRRRRRRTTPSSPPTASPPRRRASSPPRSGSPTSTTCAASRSSRSSRRTCCWPCSTPAAGCLRAVRLGSVRHAHPRPGRSADLLADGDTRWIHRGGLRPDGLTPRRPSAPSDAARPQPLRLVPEQLADPTLVRFPAASPHVRGIRHRHRSPGRHPARVQRGDARHGPRVGGNRFRPPCSTSPLGRWSPRSPHRS